jgi:hypothetical protein
MTAANGRAERQVDRLRRESPHGEGMWVRVTDQENMIEQDDFRPDRATACHEMLLRLAGRVPDSLMARSRDWLARGELSAVAHSLASVIVSQYVVLAEPDSALLSAVLSDANIDRAGLAELTLGDFDPFPCYAFAPQAPLELHPGEEVQALGAETVDQAAVEAVAAEPSARGVWRAWRFPSSGAPWPPPRRVFVVEVRALDDLGVAVRIQKRLAAAGDVDPQVEIYQSGHQIPAYQQFARSGGELLWAAADDPGIQLAAVFDEFDSERGPSFHRNHPSLAGSEVDKVARYLYAGEPLLIAAGLMDDLVDRSQECSVPMSLRTDGAWIWNEASAYYAEEHRLEPHAGLLAHIRSNDYAVPTVDGVAVYRALQVLHQSASQELMWIFEGDLSELEPDLGLSL